MDTPSTPIAEFAKATKSKCLYLAGICVLILIFMVSPLKHISVCSNVSRAVISAFILFMIYMNVKQTNTIADTICKLPDGRINIVCNHVFTASLIILLAVILRSCMQSK